MAVFVKNLLYDVLSNVSSFVTDVGEGIGVVNGITGKVPGRHPLRINVVTIKHINRMNLVIPVKISPHTRDEKTL
jgi:hypothetical protein